MDIAAWLQDLGLERYAPAFRDNEIDERVLPSLTADDLKELGVTLVGHRRRLLDAIAALGAAVTAAPSDRPAPAEAERRQLTVMFCDLVGSTALSTRHDPEDLRELIGNYHRAVAGTVGRFDGFVASYMGGRPPAAALSMLSRHPLPTTRPSAPTRRHQARHWHLPLLPHPRWPRRHCCWPPPHRTNHHSCSRLTNLLTRCKH
jgi:SAM domain (Sterile alpha motif)